MSLNDLLKELQQKYLASIPDKVEGLAMLWKHGELELLETEYHKLKGTGRTYGLPEITQIGAALERLCEIDKPSLKEAVPLSIKLIERVRELRLIGETPSLDNEPDFKTITALVEAADRRAGN